MICCERSSAARVSALLDLASLAHRLLDDLLGALLGSTPELALLDEEGGLLLGACEDALRLLLGSLDEAAGLLVDALGLADLLRHGDAQLVDQIERRHLVHDHGIGHGHAAAIGHQGLQALDEEDDVDGGKPLLGDSTAL